MWAYITKYTILLDFFDDKNVGKNTKIIILTHLLKELNFMI